MSASGSGQRAVSANGWDARLYWLWILYNAAAFVTVLTAGFLLAALGSNVLHLSLASHHVVVALLIAWATVFSHARRVAAANPINALRYE